MIGSGAGTLAVVPMRGRHDRPPSNPLACSRGPPHLKSGARIADQLEAGAAAQQRAAGGVGGEEGVGADRRGCPVGPLLLRQLAVACREEQG